MRRWSYEEGVVLFTFKRFKINHVFICFTLLSLDMALYNTIKHY